jgi:hypothetical protein
MKRTYLNTALLFIIAQVILTSCEKKLPTEFGNSVLYFSSTSSIITYQGINADKIENIKAETDTVYLFAAVYRSGIVDNLEEIIVSLAIDSAYLDSIIVAAQTARPTEMTDLMSTFKNSKALGATYFSIPQTVTIQQGQRRVAVPIQIRRSLVKMYDNAYFNYNNEDLDNPTVPKDKRIVLPLKITGSSSIDVLPTHNRYFFQILKIGDLK